MKNKKVQAHGADETCSTSILNNISVGSDKKKKANCKLFIEENLPEHHYETVKQWLQQFRNEILLFAKRFEKKIDRTQSLKIFSKDFKIDDINESFTSFDNIIDSTISGLEGFRGGIGDYILTWKALVNGDLSDSSVELVCDEANKSDKATDLLHDESSKDSIQSKNNDSSCGKDSKVGLIRIRNVSELNNLAPNDLGNDNAGSLNKTCSKTCKNAPAVTEEIAVIDSSDESSTTINDNSSKNKPTSISISGKKETKKNFETITKALSSQEAKDELDSSLTREEEPVKEICISTDEDTVIKKPVSKAGKINWNTSSEDEDSERDWVVRKKKTFVDDDNDKDKKDSSPEKKKKKLLTKKERSKKEESVFSDSDDEFNKLCNLDSLKKKRKVAPDSNLSSIPEVKKKQKSESKKNKKNDISLSDCLNESDSDSSKSSMNFELDFLNKLKSLKYTEAIDKIPPNMDEFGRVCSDSDNGLHVLTDSSLDELVEKLSKKAKIVRGTSKRKKEGGGKETKRRKFRDKLLEEKLTETDTTEGEQRYQKHKMKTRIEFSDSDEDLKPKGGSDSDNEEDSPKLQKEKKVLDSRGKRRSRRNLFRGLDDSDESDESGNENGNDEKEKSDDKEDEEMKEDSEEDKTVNKKKRKRIQRQSDSDSENENANTPSKGDGKGRKNIRKVLKEESLEKTTKEALKEEEERKQRILQKQKMYNELISKVSEEVKVLEELVLDFDVETKEPIVCVDKDLVRKLKPHQAEGIKFMWDSCFESAKDAKEGKGSGCILAHCMGLGKTLQVITLVHTLLTSEKVDVNRVLIVCPFSTVQNWVNEFRKWLKDVGSGEDFEVYNMIKTAVNHRAYQLRDWERTGGVMILGYNLFRTLVTPKSRMKGILKKAVEQVLLDPGPDVVVCDEGHILKNEKTAIAKAMSKLKTRRRIVLTGTPLQNNLVEYHCMVQFVKPNLLGTRKEFTNRFVAPIQNGQFEDSTANDVKVMKRRAHVLHKMLDGIVQRKDYNVLTPYLPPKYEYVIHVKLTEVQCKLYRHYLEHFARKSKNEGGGLFQDFQHLLRICTHPRSLLIHSDKALLKKGFEEDDESEGSLKDFIDDGSDSEKSTPPSSDAEDSDSSRSRSRSKTPPKRKNTRAARAAGNVSSSDEAEDIAPKRTEWWSEMVTEEELCDIKSSSKLFLFFTILKHCEEIGDKLLVFSQSLYTLDLIEHFLDLIDENHHKKEEERNPLLNEFNSNWDKGLDYFRLDGATSSDCRANWCKVFNQASNTRGRLFLISTRAGGLGINLTGANRVIIFDASWNPSFDVQSIFRVYRFGQEKPCYIYRFLSKGTMEEKIYERQVAKLSTSLRVIDEQQIDRHFTQTSLAELYAFNPDAPENRETPILPKDRLMAELLQNYSDLILKHHQHDSLLENQEDEELNEEERKAAWQEFENEKNNPTQSNYNTGGNYLMNMANNPYANPNIASMNLQYRTILENVITKIKLADPTIGDDLLKERAFQVMQTIPFFAKPGFPPFQQNQYPQFNMQQQMMNQQQQMLKARQMQFQQQLMMQQQMMSPQLINAFANTQNMNGASANFAGPTNSTNKPSTTNQSAGTQQDTSGPSKESKNSAGGSAVPIEINDD